MDESKKRVLVAVDGSQGSFEAVRYVSELLPPDRLEVMLFHVATSIPESFWDIESNPAFRSRLASVRAWEIGQRAAMEEYLAKAKKLLADRGFPEDAVTAESRERQATIRADLKNVIQSLGEKNAARQTARMALEVYQNAQSGASTTR